MPLPPPVTMATWPARLIASSRSWLIAVPLAPNLSEPRPNGAARYPVNPVSSPLGSPESGACLPSERVEEHGLGLVFRLQQILSPLGSRQEPGIEAMSLCDLEASRLAIILFQRETSLDLYGPNQDAPRQAVHVDLELLGNTGFLCWFDPVQPGIDENPLTEMRSPGPDLNDLVPQEDQLCPGLSDAQGSHVGVQLLPWEISQRRRTERMYAFSSHVRACPKFLFRTFGGGSRPARRVNSPPVNRS